MDPAAATAAAGDEAALRPAASMAEATGVTPAPVAPGANASAVAGPANSRLPAVLQTAAALLWLPQAGLISHVIGTLAAEPSLRVAVWPAAGVLLIGTVKAALEAGGTRLAFADARKVLSERRATAIAALAARSPLDAARPASGLAASVLAEQAEMVVPYLARFRPARLKASLVPIAVLLCVLPFSWVAALVLLIAAPLIPVFMALIGWRAKAASEEQLAETGGLNGFLLDRLRGLTTIRALGAVELTALRLRTEAQSLRRRTMVVLRIAFLSSAVLELFAALGVALTAVYVGFHLLGALNFGSWGTRLSLSEGLFILLLAPAMFEPLRDLSAVWHDRASGEAALQALYDLAKGGTPLPGAGIEASVATVRTPTPPPSVMVAGLRFCHAGSNRPVLDGFHLSVAAGEHVALLGPSGSGKSTLLALIAGLAGIDSGCITIDGLALDPLSAGALRSRMAWIGQRPHLFAGSLAANITLGRDAVGPRETAAALHMAALTEVARAHGQRPIGENGIGLSGGEALRLALARACADPTAELVLADEPTAHLDRQTADDIIEGLLLLGHGRTLIVATHDPLLAARMDRIVDLRPQNLECGS